jgi:hypothetical protein
MPAPKAYANGVFPALHTGQFTIQLARRTTHLHALPKNRLNYIFPPEQAELENHCIAMNFQPGF